MAANLGRNLREGRIRIIQAIMAKARAAHASAVRSTDSGCVELHGNRPRD
jgi:hypothetical protein